MAEMKLSERFEQLKKFAQADARAARNRPTIFSGSYPKKAATLDGIGLLEDVKTAKTLGYETHLRVTDDTLEVYYVKNMPGMPTEVSYP